MAVITLQNSSKSEVTILTNNFIDNYMPEANGEFVKVYIYLLRLLSDASAPFQLEQMADRLSCTERDILRALKYWEKENLLSLRYRSSDDITDISLLVPPAVPEGERSPDRHPQPAKIAADLQEQPRPKPALTSDRVQELKQNEDITQLFYVAEQYLGKTLTSTEMKKLLFFYDELKLSPELIEYLIEYSVSRGHKSMRYIEAVATAWAKEGVATVAMAKEANSRYAREYYTILKSMGINGRSPVETEVRLMDVWLHDYSFDLELIQEACSRTVLQTGQPSFQYADKILSGWKEQEVKTLEDVRLLDAEYQKRKLEKSIQKKNAVPKSASTNRFNNFHQRKYDFDEYEKKLLNPNT